MKNSKEFGISRRREIRSIGVDVCVVEPLSQLHLIDLYIGGEDVGL